MLHGFVTLFTETDLISWIALGVSLACLVAEVFIPSFGLVGIGGLLIGIVGVGFNASNKPWLDTADILWLVVDTLIIFVVVVLVIKITYVLLQKKKKKVKKETLVVDGKEIPADAQGNPDYSFLKGRAGVCVTDLNPSGKVDIDGEVYNVHSDKGYLYNGNMVRVIRVSGAIIYVDKIQS